MKMAGRSSRSTSSGTTVATVTVGELRTSFKAVEKKLAQGIRVQVTRRGEVVAEMSAAGPGAGGEIKEAKKGWLDFIESHQERMKEIWGDTVVDINTTALISEGRDRDLLL